MHLECNFHNPSPPCSTAICKRKHAPKACTCIMECVEAWINSFKIWWWLCTKGQVSVMPIFEDEGHTTLSEWLWMQPIQRVKQFRLQKSNRMWWPVDMQSLRGHVWGETNGWRGCGCKVSTDLVGNCVHWDLVTSLVIFLNWSDCWFGSNQAPITHQTFTCDV